MAEIKDLIDLKGKRPKSDWDEKDRKIKLV